MAKPKEGGGRKRYCCRCCCPVKGGCCWCCSAAAVLPLALVAFVLLVEKPVVEMVKPPGKEVLAHVAEEELLPATSALAPAANISFMFDRIAASYDSVNRGMSLGLDQHLRQILVQDCLHLQPGDHVLDLATGTGAVALMAAAKLRELAKAAGSSGTVVGLDVSSEMLRQSASKVKADGLHEVLSLVRGDMQDMRNLHHTWLDSSAATSIESESIDKISVAFGLRSLADRRRALREMRRVLRSRPGSRVCILETVLPTDWILPSHGAHRLVAYMVRLLTRLAIRGFGREAERAALERSILGFPQPKEFATVLASEGLPVRTITSFASGAVRLYEVAPA
mmetsp:Transcript_87218/g.150564  ORF Transcript_87218/g.150564 Transcript_87218/m.150564 type:complete len:338 (+) Transcript_87218:26-1039(+)